ncbi:hypothetical protein [Algoriphagus sp. AK58]|uniref:hypothetical protein n=1 Tax=Algoriphagus sp. AK58 TaxID=1406877 RepID=UPI00164F4765|nr:hypothetical protein [Algoriphagus sp. AK58]MBC6365804.1 hypothetical protein [Algoriphagus sp. AK58]
MKIKTGWKGETDPFYYSASWRSLRKKHIDLYPLDELKLQFGIVSPAVIVDHIIPRSITKEFELEEFNLQSLDFLNHQQKTAQTRGINTLDEFLYHLEFGKLQSICTEEKKIRLLELLRNRN